MLTIEELDRMDDLSGSALLSAEVKRIPLLPQEEQPTYIEAARGGDELAQQRLVVNCLNWTMTKAASIYQDREPAHSDLMDLVSHAQLKMMEALPRALRADDPLRYLMSVSALEMRLYCSYDDPMVKRSRWRPKSDNHPVTVSLEAGTVPSIHTIAAPDVRLDSEEPPGQPPNAEYHVVYEAIRGLSDDRREVVTAAFGLFDSPAMHTEDIALMLNVPKKTVENYLYRAKTTLARKLGPFVVEQ